MEKMLSDAALYSTAGYVSVLISLVLLVAIIVLLSIILSKMGKPTQNTVSRPVSDISPFDEDEEEIVAVITAAIAASINTTPDRLMIKSLKRVSNWNSTVKQENFN